MLRFMLSGGFAMWFIAALGGALLWTTARFARAADPQRLALARALSMAMTASSLTGFITGLVATCHYVLKHPEEPAHLVVLTGFAESCANLVLGGGLLVLAWVLIAVGVRRMPRDA